MKRKLRVPFQNPNFDNWQNFILIALFIFYLFQFGIMFAKDSFLEGYGVDYLAFWSAGKIADDKGYAVIYDLENLRSTQTQLLETQGLVEKGVESNISPFPAPILSIFVLPFQLLSRVNPKQSYWIWTGINLVVLIGYLIFFHRKTFPKKSPFSPTKQMLFLMLLSFPIFINLTEGQVEVFLIVCLGEFIRNALNKKPFSSGLWLGGLLLKPQLLIIIIPILIIYKNWKVLIGFFATSAIIIGGSFILSGYKSMRSLIDLWTRYSAGIATASPERMINWRMVAENFNSPFGWVVAILGMVLTIIAIYFIVKNNYSFGTSRWVVIMLGIFSATLAITWHSHFHMAAVLIPSLIYCSFSQMLSNKVVYFWAIATPAILISISIIALLVFSITGMKINSFAAILLGISGFLSNIAILISVLYYLRQNDITQDLPSQGNKTAYPLQ